MKKKTKKQNRSLVGGWSATSRDPYIAAMIDVCGSISLTRSFRQSVVPYYSLEVKVNVREPALTIWISEQFVWDSGEGYLGTLSENRWRLRGPAAQAVLLASIPYLVIKRRQATIGIQFQQAMDNISARRREHKGGYGTEDMDLLESMMREMVDLNA